ncbi:excinuclease ABC subunit B [Jannaschia sp. M317]|uniref:excinuclease ABC subunit B n=1 Tax=Jannaschia sp. M317 TaxID=2867011 RepID=UPI0021A8B362|nr:excinuclease ABC subunit B [Jannaschia sp. M317]UWQ16643.1 excinuclease ABC subunit B [Jannaschia sp. M317]
MLRYLIFLLLPAQAFAWTFTATPICTLQHDDKGIVTTVTFEPASGVYALHLDRAEGWPPAPFLAIRFDGVDLTISTTRHRITGPRLTVTDRGFGNVLSGIEGGGRALVALGDLVVPIDLTDAAPEVALFRACPQAGLV